MATFGHTPVYSNDTSCAPGDQTGYKFTIANDDGWVTSAHIYLLEVHGNYGDYRICTWDGARVLQKQSSLSTMYPNTKGWRVHEFGQPIQLNRNQVLWVGVHVPANGDDVHLAATAGSSDDISRYQDGSANSPPSSLGGTQFSGTALSGYFTYTANVAPSTGTWQSPTPANGALAPQSGFDIAGNMPHGSDSAFDSTTSVQVQIWRQLTGAMVGDKTFAPTASEVLNNKWQRNITTLLTTALQSGTAYVMRYRHYDQFGEFSGWSAERTFSTLAAPGTPTTIAPSGKINVVSGFNFSAIYFHPSGVTGKQAQVEVWNANNTTMLYSTTVTGLNIATGATYTLAEWFADLLWATNYTWRIRFHDGTNWGNYSAFVPFNTNMAPSAPSNLFPANGLVYGQLDFSATIGDPDGDPIQEVQIEVVKVSDGSLVHSGTMVVDNAAKLATKTLGAGILVNNTAYRWRARAGDFNRAVQGYSPWSSYAEFTWAQGADVTILSPSNARVNLVEQPAMYSDLGLTEYWTESNRAEGTNYISVVEDSEAPSGTGLAFRGVGSATVAYASANKIVGTTHAVDITRPYLVALEANKLGGTTSAHLAVRCYSAADADLGLVYPASFATLNATNIPAGWARYGGVIGLTGITPAWPATTAKARIEIVPANGTGATTRFDSIQFEKLPAITSSSDWTGARSWFGFGAGSTVIDPQRSTGYSWNGNPENSSSNILPVLIETTSSALITYSHTSAKDADKIVIWEWRRDRWVQVYDSGWISSARTLIPIDYRFTNSKRHKIQVSVRDVLGVIVNAPAQEVDTYYVGPEVLSIESIEPLPGQGAMLLTFEQSVLPPEEFGGIEIARSAGTEPFEIVASLNNQNAATFQYDAPASDLEYTFRVRQVRVAGNIETQSRWSSAKGSVSYRPNFFIKDLANPSGTLVGFRVQKSDFSPDVRSREEVRHEIRGKVSPLYWIGDARSWRREVVAYLNPHHGFAESVEDRWQRILDMVADRTVVIFLDPFHNTKMVGRIVDEATLDLGVGESRKVSLVLEAVEYFEDITDQRTVI